MPQAKKSTPKKSNVAQANKVNTKYKFKPWHAIAGLALFIAGGFVVAYSQASSDYAASKAQLPLIQYENGAGPAISEKDGTTTKLTQGPRSIQLTQAGDLYCFGENQNQGSVRKLSKPEVTQIIQDVSTSGLAELPVPETEGGVETKLVRYIDPASGEIVTIDVANVQSDNPAYAKVVAVLQTACAKSSQPSERKDAPKVKPKESAPTTMNVPAIQRSLIGTANAASSDPRIQWLTRFNDVLRWNIQNARATRGIAQYIVEPCLGVSASNWSGTVASYYNADPAAKTSGAKMSIWHSDLKGPIEKACGTNWIRLGENVGWYHAINKKTADQAANEIFNLYMNSTLHREAILDPRFNRFNVGSIMTNDGNRVYNTTHFMLR